MILDQKRVLYYQSKRAMHQGQNKLMIPVLCLGAFGSFFTLAFFGKFLNHIFKVGKNIAIIGLKKVLL
jgi:hypothetical protein